MKNRTKGVIAGIAGLALLSGGTTFALWQDNTNVTGGTITNGDLAVAATPITWVDNSADRPTHPTVDLTTWKMVPGDTLVGTTTITTTMMPINAPSSPSTARVLRTGAAFSAGVTSFEPDMASHPSSVIGRAYGSLRPSARIVGTGVWRSW